MARTSKSTTCSAGEVKEKRNFRLKIWATVIIIPLLLYYLWKKCCDLIILSQQQDNKGWWSGYFASADQSTSTFDLTGTEIYWNLFTLIKEDITYLFNSVIYFPYVIIVIIVIIASVYLLKHGQNDERLGVKDIQRKRITGGRNKVANSVNNYGQSSWCYWNWVCLVGFVAFLLSIPWEFVRLYQTMLAEKVAQVTVGMPPECVPDQMSFTQSLKSWLRLQLSWSHDPCLKYHKALLVDPMWQVSPLMVFSSAVSHCLVYPLEVFFGGLARAMHIFFAEIPTAYQPVLLICFMVIIIIILIMTFGYRIDLPFLKFEPKTSEANISGKRETKFLKKNSAS